MESNSNKKGNKIRRAIVGLLGVAMLGFAMYTWFVTGIAENNAFITGVFSKVGLVLLAAYLAWPLFETSVERSPLLFLGITLPLIVFLAIRPRLLPLLIAFLVVVMIVHFGLRYVAQNSGRRR